MATLLCVPDELFVVRDLGVAYRVSSLLVSIASATDFEESIFLVDP